MSRRINARREAEEIWDTIAATAIVCGVSYAAGEMRGAWAVTTFGAMVFGRLIIAMLKIMGLWPFREVTQ